MSGANANRSGGNRRSGQSSGQPISAPYNFVPHAEFVHTPDWGRQVTHDVPFKDGLSGEIAYTLTAHTPLLVGGKQTKPTEHAPGEVKPWQDPDGTYAIPGASLKGMLRNVLEIAGFGRMRLVDDGKLSVRDLTGGVPLYQAKMTETVGGAFGSRVCAGWLSLTDAGGRIRPCDFARVEHDDLAQLATGRDRAFWLAVGRGPAKDKYKRWGTDRLVIQFEPGEMQAHSHSKNKLRYKKALSLGQGATHGTLVFTGQPAKRDPEKSGRKHMEFVFYNEQPDPRVIEDQVWSGFLSVHEGSKEWKYWRGKTRIPVFYLTDEHGAIESVGLAMMYRLPYSHSLHDALGNTSQDHLAAPGTVNGYDLADLLFGVASEEQNDSLRARVSCLSAKNTNQSEAVKQKPTILNGPKPSYYPNYIRQDTDGKGVLRNGKYVTLMDAHVQLRGFKRYPVRGKENIQVLEGKQIDNPKVQMVLHPLPTGASFDGRIVFHNLKPVELGALLWALNWGGDDQLCHALGMGKPFGMGQVSLVVDDAHSSAVPNNPANPVKTLDASVRQEYMDAFAKHMEQACDKWGGWKASLQMRSLLAMADPGKAPVFEQAAGKLAHMRLGEGNNANEFATAKKEKKVLTHYAVAAGAYDKPLPRLCEPAVPAARSLPRKSAAVDDTPVDPSSFPASRFVAARLYRDRNNKLFVELKGKPLWVAPKHEKALLAPLPEKLVNNLSSKDKPKVWVALASDNKAVVSLKPR